MTSSLASILNAWWKNRFIKCAVTLLWIGINGVLCWRAFLYYKHEPKFYLIHQMLGAGFCTSRATAVLINLNLGALLLPMCRLSMSLLRDPSLRLSKQSIRTVLDSCKWYHELCARLLVLSSAVHFCGHCFNACSFSSNYSSQFPHLNAASFKGQNPVFVVLYSVPGVTGVALTLILIVLVITSSTQIRQRNYNLFWYSHKLSAVFYVIVLIHAFRGILTEQTNVSQYSPECVHLNLSNSKTEEDNNDLVDYRSSNGRKCAEEPKFAALGSSSWMWLTGPAVLYVLESLYRCLYSRSNPAVITGVHLHPSGVLEVEMYLEKFTCRPGQFILLLHPAVSYFEWHPFTVSKCPTDDDSRFTVHINVSNGDWSAKLSQLLQPLMLNARNRCLCSATESQMLMHIDGPFGSPMEEILCRRIVVCVAGGMGITPFAAILEHIGRSVKHIKTKRFYLIWMSRDVEKFLTFAKLLCNVHQHLWKLNRPDMVTFQLFATGQPNEAVIREHLEPSFGLLARRIFSGRPNWENLFEYIASVHSRQNVAVFSCGPKALNQHLTEICLKQTFHQTVFELFHESF